MEPKYSLLDYVYELTLIGIGLSAIAWLLVSAYVNYMSCLLCRWVG